MKTTKTYLVVLGIFIAFSLGCSEQIQVNHKTDWLIKGVKRKVAQGYRGTILI